MNIPILKQQSAFDGTQEHKLEFTWQGNQVFKNRLIVRKNSDNVVIYDAVSDNMQLFSMLPANILPNGTQYSAQVSVFDVNNVESPLSSPILFYCYTSPTFDINISENQIIHNSNYTVVMSYSQLENELLQDFQIILYDTSYNQIFSSGLLYPTQTTSTIISSLTNNTQYNIKAIGTTVEGTILDTGYISFSVAYIQPDLFSMVELTNLPHQASIKIKTNFIDIEGKSTSQPPTFIDGTKIDLRVNGEKVEFNKGINFNSFTMEYTGQDITPCSTFLQLSNGVYNISVRYMLGKFNDIQQCYFLLTVQNSFTEYRIATQPMNVLNNGQSVNVIIKKINNLYDINAII